MSSKVETLRVVDKRIEPQPAPVYAATVGPEQNQYYKIPASGLSDSSLTFNNLTTLGINRAYLDTFELELTCDVTFGIWHETSPGATTEILSNDSWCFESFPFAKCCDEVRVNVNGGAFFSSPLCYLRAKERYWDDKDLNEAYPNSFPCNKPWVINELGVTNKAWMIDGNGDKVADPSGRDIDPRAQKCKPLRLYDYNTGYGRAANGPTASINNDIVKNQPAYRITEGSPAGHYSRTIRVTWREPVLASPFSSKIDATYGRPLYNITSLDLAFTMQNLSNMIRVGEYYIDSVNVHIISAQLCYQVLTLPDGIPRPTSTVVPYRRMVPYITDVPISKEQVECQFEDATFAGVENPGPGDTLWKREKPIQLKNVTSGVYTLNEVPTAIWIFLGPSRRLLQQNPDDGWIIAPSQFHGLDPTTGMGLGFWHKIWSFNKTFAIMDHISISCANTTQILNTATKEDLYRIAKANGCKDSFASWGHDSLNIPGSVYGIDCPGCGSVLRIIPGTDFVLPDQPLIPGSNAHNMVFQVSADFTIPCGWPENYREFSLWLLFEYVGVATITPGQCDITMNPLGDRGISPSAPTVSATQSETPSSVEGSGWLDKLKNAFGIAKNIAKETGILSKAAQFIPGVGGVASNVLQNLGYGVVGAGKRRRCDDMDRMFDPGVEGGAVMGYGDFM